MNHIEAMKQALEALELCNGAETADGIVVYTDKEITSLRQAIAEAEKQEPVAWRFKTGTFWNREPHWRYVLSLEGTEGLQGLEPLYTHPQPKREPLTDEQIEKAITDKYGGVLISNMDICRAIEAAHGIKEKQND